MTRHPEQEVALPEGATILRRSAFEPSVELALQLARMGASDELISAVGGQAALEEIRALEPGRGNGQPATGPGEQLPEDK